MKIYLFTLLLILPWTLAIQDIRHFGAIANEDSLSAQIANQKAINKAVEEAGGKDAVGDERIVVIPENKKFYTMPVMIQDTHNIVIEVRGKWLACNRIKNYPKSSSSNRIRYADFIVIDHCSNITIRGGGKIDGRGYVWWLNSWLVTKKYMPSGAIRPHMIAIDNSRNVVVHDLTLKNGQTFHLRTTQTIGGTFYNLDIKVNTTAQLDIFKRNFLTGIIPLFPLNTDGIDPGGRDFHIYNITCQNYDDVVVPKPSNAGGELTNCTQDMLIENITIRLGVGLSIGSLSPNDGVNCIRNITFRNANFEKPLKGIYLKTNPGDTGRGIIADITYENMTMHEPIWWAIYLGPQQQKQPGGGGPGCMLYPFDPKGKCDTQPLVDVSNIKLKNIIIRNSLLFPIVLRCNEKNPCKNVTFENVQVKGWWIGKKDKGYVCQNVEFTGTDSYPKVECTKASSHRFLTEETTVSYGPEERMSEQILLQKLQKASDSIPYLEQDDQMFLSEAQMLEDSLQFRKTMMISEQE